MHEDLDHTDRLDDLGGLPLRPVPTLDGRASAAAAAHRPRARRGSDLARVLTVRPGVQLREYGNGRIVFYAYAHRGRDTQYIGSFGTEAEALRAVNESARSKRERTIEERACARAFVALRKCPWAWHLRGLSRDEQVAKIHALPQSIRLLILRHVPVEDDPIFCVAMSDPDGSNLAEMARLYGCTREYMRQIGDKATEKIERLDGLDEYRDHARRVTAWEEMGG